MEPLIDNPEQIEDRQIVEKRKQKRAETEQDAPTVRTRMPPYLSTNMPMKSGVVP